jgi:predicted CoA-binding protein
VQSPTDTDLRDVLQGTRTIAILGAHTDPGKPACYVPDYLHAHGYEVFAVNPLFAGRTLWDHPCVFRPPHPTRSRRARSTWSTCSAASRP